MNKQQTKELGLPVLLSIALIMIGVLLRLDVYLQWQSIWLDEAYAAVEIISKSFKDMFIFLNILDDQPRMPVLFQVVSKVFIELWGNHELALRLLPFTGGILSLVLYYLLLRKIARPSVILIALALFALNGFLVYYSAEFKPYSVDVLATIVIYLLFIKLRHKNYPVGGVYLFALVAGFLLWFSFACLFISYGVILTMIALSLFSNEKKRAGRWVIALLIYLLFFLLIYGTQLKPMTANKYLLVTWEGGFMPVKDGMAASFQWAGAALTNVFKDPLGLPGPYFVFVIFLIGIRRCMNTDKELALVLIMPVLVVFLAACLQKYPFKGRVLLFVVPVFFHFIAEGICSVSDYFRKLRHAAYILMFLFAMSSSVIKAGENWQTPPLKTENRPVMAFLTSHAQPGDIVFYNNSAQYAFYYYSNQLGLASKLKMRPQLKSLRPGHYHVRVAKMSDQVVNHDDEDSIGFYYEYLVYHDQVFTGLLHREKPLMKYFLNKNMNPDLRDIERVWVFLSHMYPQPKALALTLFNELGREVLSFERYDAGVYLFELEGR